MATVSEQVQSAASAVIIVDDHPILRRGLAALIESTPDLAVCGEAATPKEALDQIRRKQPDVVIVDLKLEDSSSGFEIIKAMKSEHPKIPSLVLSMHDEMAYAERSLRAGAKGYVSKQTLDDTVLGAIRCVLAGDTYMSDTLAARLAKRFVSGQTLATDSPLDALSDRELQVFELIGQGLSTREIATKLILSIKTIESHVEHIKHKLNLESAAALVRRAIMQV